MTQPNFIDETGNKYGKLTVISREQNTIYGTAKWLCKCECGNTKECRGQDLRSGRITHCGCENKPKKITNYFKIKNMSVDEMAEYMCLMARVGIKATLNNIGISDKEIDFPPIEKSIEACKQELLQEVEDES